MKFLITGGSGFVGKIFSEKLVEKYASKNNEFIFIARKRNLDFLKKFKDAKIRVVRGDISDIGSIRDAFKGIDYVFHLAAKVDYGDIDKKSYYLINTEGAKNVFELSLQNKVKKIIYLSTAGIFHPTYNEYVSECSDFKNKHNTKYTRSKHLAYLKSLEFIKNTAPIINILPVAIFGENSPLFKPIIKQIIKRKIIIIPKMKSRLSLVYVNDLVEGIIKAFEKGKIGESYIFSGNDFNIRNIIFKIAKILNKKIILIESPKILFFPVLKFFDFYSLIFRKKLYYNSEFFNFISGGLLARHDKAERELNFSQSNFNKNFENMVKNSI